MRYTIRSLWLGWIGVVVALGGAQFAHAQSMATKWLPAVTQIITTTSKGDYATGTGFFIEGGDLITAYHVVQGAKKLRVLMNDGSMREAIVKNFDSERDLAALTLQPPYKPSLQMSLADAPAGLTTASGVVLGHPDQKKDFAIRVSFPTDAPIKAIRWIAPSTGNTTSAFRFETQDLELIVLDGTLNRGMSGGPVLVGDKVVGVFSGGEQRSGAGLAWAIPVKYLKQLKPNGAKLRADQLPRLSMLNQGVEALVACRAGAVRVNQADNVVHLASRNHLLRGSLAEHWKWFCSKPMQRFRQITTRDVICRLNDAEIVPKIPLDIGGIRSLGDCAHWYTCISSQCFGVYAEHADVPSWRKHRGKSYLLQGFNKFGIVLAIHCACLRLIPAERVDLYHAEPRKSFVIARSEITFICQLLPRTEFGRVRRERSRPH